VEYVDEVGGAGAVRGAGGEVSWLVDDSRIRKEGDMDCELWGGCGLG